MKKKSKALNATEISIVAALVFIVSLGAVFTCGDYFAKIFGNNPILSMFTFGRGKNSLGENITKYLSGISINLGGLNITSPVEDAFTETDGSLGDLQRHIAIIQNYIKMLEQIITELEEQGINADAFKKALQAYQDALTQYTEMNNLKVGDTFTWDGKSITITSESQLALIKKAMDLDIMLDLTQNGSAASALNTALTSLLGKVDNETYKNLLEAFTKDLLSLGANTDFKVDSRLVGDNILPQDLINLLLGDNNTGNTGDPTYHPSKNEGLALNTAFTMANALSNYKDNESFLIAAHNLVPSLQLINNNGEIMIYENGVYAKTCDTASCNLVINGYNLVINSKTFTREFFDVTIYTDGGCYEAASLYIPPSTVPAEDSSTTTTTGIPADPEALRNLLIAIALDPTNEKYKGIDVEALTKTIDVYRNGTYVDMAENTYNNAVVCTSMGGTVQGEQCTFN